MGYLNEIFLPSNVDDARDKLERVEGELIEQYGGVTLHISSPAKGLWDGDTGVESDKIVVIEVISDELDRRWWAGYRQKLEKRFDQDEVMIRATIVSRL